MRVIVTGGAGFLGSNCIERLLEQGHDVVSIDNHTTSDPTNLPSHDRVEAVTGDVADRALVDSTFDRFEPTHVIHSAASYQDPDDWEGDARTNVLGTVHVVQAAERHRCKRLVHFQTALCYGPPRTKPVELSHPLDPRTSYAITKTAGEQIVAMGSIPWVSLRMAIVYGPRHFSGPMPAFYKRLRAGQPCRIVRTHRDFVAVNDFLRLMDQVLMDGAPTGVFHLSSGREITIEDLHHLMARKMGVDTPRYEVVDPGSDEVLTLLLDPTETQRAFGWSADTELEHGLDRIIAWYDAHGVEQTYSHLRR